MLCAGTQQAAAQDATYLITFAPLWSASTHPQDFPASAHFSDFVGATHDATVSFWAPGALSSTGVKNVAELGNPAAFWSEIDAAVQQGSAATLVESAAFFLDTTRESKTTFVADAAHPLLTVITMLAPSPDWFAGLRDFELQQDGEWVSFAEVDLYAQDAGTDSGPTYTSSNQPTVPPVPIAPILGFPLESQGSVAPVVRVQIQRIDQPFCDLDLDQVSYGDGDPFTIQLWRFANYGAADVAVETKAWIEVPGAFFVPLSNSGADGSLTFTAGQDSTFGPLPLFTLNPGFPRGRYEVGCRLLDPITGEALSIDRNFIEVE